VQSIEETAFDLPFPVKRLPENFYFEAIAATADSPAGDFAFPAQPGHCSNPSSALKSAVGGASDRCISSPKSEDVFQVNPK
jgi:hypothetical protein